VSHEKSKVKSWKCPAAITRVCDAGVPGAGGKALVGRAVPCAPLSAIVRFNGQPVGQWSDVAAIGVIG
jgi:hypothetical protein